MESQTSVNGQAKDAMTGQMWRRAWAGRRIGRTALDSGVVLSPNAIPAIQTDPQEGEYDDFFRTKSVFIPARRKRRRERDHRDH